MSDAQRRKSTVARMAGNIAAGICRKYTTDLLSGRKEVAEQSLQIAELIYDMLESKYR